MTLACRLLTLHSQLAKVRRMRGDIIKGMAPNQVFGRLTTVEATENRQRWICRCECGNLVPVKIYSLHDGTSQSCGCFAQERQREANIKHGASIGRKVKRLYNIWQHMRDRCRNPNNEWFKNYGGRGISVCEEWAGSECYPAFEEWALANGYADTLTIERIDYDGNYEPKNSTWIPKSEQSDNRRINVWLRAFGETKFIKDWGRDPRCRVSAQSLGRRIKQGWDAESAITTPPTWGNQHNYFGK